MLALFAVVRAEVHGPALGFAGEGNARLARGMRAILRNACCHTHVNLLRAPRTVRPYIAFGRAFLYCVELIRANGPSEARKLANSSRNRKVFGRSCQRNASTRKCAQNALFASN